jgi:prolipoprotein diacylglyceryltransferase
VGSVSGAFLLGYGVFRFTAEHFREPDSYLGILGLGLSMGQWLCIPMILAGSPAVVVEPPSGPDTATRTGATDSGRHGR